MQIKTMIGAILAGAALSATTLAAAGATAGEEFLTNGDLQPANVGWTRYGEGTFVAIPGVGARMTSTAVTMDEASIYASQCVPLKPGLEYHFQGDRRIPTDQNRSGFTFFVARFHSGPGCAGSIVDQHMSAHASATDGWEQVSMALSRTNGQPAKSLTVAMVVKKDETNRPIKKDKTFSADFRELSVRGTAPALACVEFDCGDGSGAEDDKPHGDGPIGCVVGSKGCPGEHADKPVIVPPAPLAPPVHPPAGEPAPGGAPQPTTPEDVPTPATGGAGQQQQPTVGEQPATTGGSGSGQPAAGNLAPASGDAPAAKPTLEPEQPGLPSASTPTPLPPATGGDSDRDPAGGFNLGPAQASPVDNSNAGTPLPMIAGSAIGLGLAALLLGIIFRRTRRA